MGKRAKKTKPKGGRSRRKKTLKASLMMSSVSYLTQQSPDQEDVDVDVDTIGSDDINMDSTDAQLPIISNVKEEIFDGSFDINTGFRPAQDYEINLMNPAENPDPKLFTNRGDSGSDALVPTASVSQDPSAMSAVDFDGQCFGGTVLPTGAINCVPEGSAVTSKSLMVPSSLVGNPSQASSPPASTAFAHVTKIEEAADGGGYLLHLNIPAFGLSNVVLSTPGLSLAPGMDEKLLGAPPQIGGPAESSLPSGDHTDHGDVNVGSGQMSDEGIDSIGDSFRDELHVQNSGEAAKETLDSSMLDHGWTDGLMSADHSVGSQSSSSSDSGYGLGDTEPSSSGSGPEADDQTSSPASTVQCWPSETPRQPWPEASPETATWDNAADKTDSKVEVEKFVICSDGPMECVLCSFKTVDYSAFKSHIICSHPCWRITKKLSKNRLLVEKAVKMNVNVVTPTAVAVPAPGGDAVVASKVRRASAGKDSSDSAKGRKGAPVCQRKKQMVERNKRLFRCAVCMRLFVFEGSIVNHLVDIHLVKTPYDHIQVSNNHGVTFGKLRRCSHDDCYASCLTEEELDQHQLESHAQLVYRCQICGYTADSADTVEKHASDIHNQYDLMFGLTD